MEIRKLLVVPMLGSALALGACGAEEEPVENEVIEEPAPTLAPEPVTAEPLETEEVEAEGVGAEPVEGAAAEIPGNGIDDDLDGEIDEAI